MMLKGRNRLGRFTIAVVLAGLGFALAGVGAASAAPSAPSAAAKLAQALVFDVNGPWTDNGSAKPVFTVVNNTVVIDMSYAHRPNAVGTVIDTSSILVTFPDADTYIGTFLTPSYLRWSNGSVWQKVYTGPTQIDLNETWSDGLRLQHISQVNGFLTVDMSQSHRPNAVGFVVNASTIRVSFPDDAAYTGTLLTPDIIRWSNGSQWQISVDQSPGNPDCLVLC